MVSLGQYLIQEFVEQGKHDPVEPIITYITKINNLK